MANRWWIYQQERFPILRNLVLAAMLSFSAVGYSMLLRDRFQTQPISAIWSPIGVALVSTLLFFLQLRISGEFRDAKSDARYYPDRPVPRGLVKLWQLGAMAIAAAAMQAGLAILLNSVLLLGLAAVWLYLGLLQQGFFQERWLKSHPLVDLLSNGLSFTLFAFYASACDWAGQGWHPPTHLMVNFIAFLLMTFCTGMAIALGRKIRFAKEFAREEDLNTTSLLNQWGDKRAVMVWLAIVGWLSLTAIAAAMVVNFTVAIGIVILPLLTSSMLLVWQFFYRPRRFWAKQFGRLSELWMFFTYGVIGVLPILLRATESIAIKTSGVLGP